MSWRRVTHIGQERGERREERGRGERVEDCSSSSD